MSAFGIYVHWPFCAAKCPYCDFNSHVRTRIDEAQWAGLVARELRSVAALQSPRPVVSSIFFGGGTPSLMSGRSVGAVLEEIAALWRISPDAEITLEANPNSVEQQRLRDYRGAGVNRVSIGVQSLDNAALRALGRLHDVGEAEQAIRSAMKLFPRVSFDLIYARPGQSLEAWRTELAGALAFGSEHLSVYQLTIETGTSFASLHRQGKLKLPDEDLAADFYDMTQEICGAAGLPAYEVSNHAKPGQESRHNLLYWRYGDYAGVGPGAHGRLTIEGRRVATESVRLPERWAESIESDGCGFSVSAVPQEDAAREHLLMNLRISEGLDLAGYAARWGMAPSPETVSNLRDLGLLHQQDGRLSTTHRGRMVLNRITKELAQSLAAL